MKECVLKEGLCNHCGACDVCDLDETKRCDNCGKCLEDGEETRSIKIDQVILDM